LVDLEKSEKLPPNRRYFNISILWIFYFRHIIRLLYKLRIPHEAVTALSILFGVYSAYAFHNGTFLLAAVALHLKDIFDASDGALARLTGRGHLIGRYLDSLGDFLALTLVMAGIALHYSQLGQSIYLFWGALAIPSTFIQCSFFNYYQLAYVDAFGIETLSSKRDERKRDDINTTVQPMVGRIVLEILRFFYMVVYGWQDRLVAAIDGGLSGNNRSISQEARYGNRILMTMQSALCFGTHIFIIICFALMGRPGLSLIFIGTIMNLYLLGLLYLRYRHYRGLKSDTSYQEQVSVQSVRD
jgi:phosphatidylserine synthase